MIPMTEAERESLRQLVTDLREYAFVLSGKPLPADDAPPGLRAKRSLSMDRLERKVLGLVERNEDEFQRLLRWIDEVTDGQPAATG